VKCAGDRLDRAVIDHVKKQYNLAIGDKTAEEVKIKIGSAIPMNEELTMLVKGRDLMSGLPRTIELSTNDLVQAMSRELREMTQAVRKVLQDTPPELASDIIDNGIILTGGSSQLRQMAELIYRRTGVIAKLANDPYYCVARGTGVALKHLDTYQKSILAKQ
jgi:rod shape-determining protein MreB